MHPDTKKYNDAQTPGDRAICQLLGERSTAICLRRKTRYGTPIRFGSSMVTHRRVQQTEELRTIAFLERPVLSGGRTDKGRHFQSRRRRYTAASQIDTEKLQIWLTQAREPSGTTRT